MKKKLLPCPLCGRKAKLVRLTNSINISCVGNDDGSCAIVLFGGSEPESSLRDQWNTRVVCCKNCGGEARLWKSSHPLQAYCKKCDETTKVNEGVV